MAGVRVPAWTLGDRLRKAREDAALSIQDMADETGYHRNTITAWESGRPIKPGMVRAWADICDVNLGWLETGEIDLLCAPGELNPEPADYRSVARQGSFFDDDWSSGGSSEPFVIDLRDHVMERIAS